jgi:hypothetical protein
MGAIFIKFGRAPTTHRIEICSVGVVIRIELELVGHRTTRQQALQLIGTKSHDLALKRTLEPLVPRRLEGLTAETIEFSMHGKS